MVQVSVFVLSFDRNLLLCFSLFVCNYLLVLQAALCFSDELDILAGESHQLTVASPQSNILKRTQ